MGALYYSRGGGRVIAFVPSGRDEDFERHLDHEAGVQWDWVETDKAHAHEDHVVTDEDGDGKPELVSYRNGARLIVQHIGHGG